MNKFFIMMLCVLLSSCSTMNDTFSPYPEKPPLNLSGPRYLTLEPVKFKVIHKNNSDKTFSEMEQNSEEPVVFALTGTDYKNLATNMQELKSYILIQRKIINLYKEYYEGANSGGQ